jgi:hydrogenase expression/formation protein HypC
VCIASPARLVALDSSDAVVEIDGRRRRASMLLRPEVEVDDWVLVAAGTVLRRIDAAEALDLRRTLDAALAVLESRTPAPSQGGPR